MTSPIPGIMFGRVDRYQIVEPRWVEVPKRVMNRALYTYVAEDGR